MKNGEISHWVASRNIDRHTEHRGRTALDKNIEADVCIIGGGFTGLWLAYHLKRLTPSLNVVIVEKHTVGYGASGRNAGWLSPLVPGNRRKFAETSGGNAEGIRLQRRMLEAVDEVLNIIQTEHIQAHAIRSGNLVVARTPAALARLRDRLTTDRAWGYHEDEGEELGASDFTERIRVSGAVGGLFYPTVGRIDPMGLVLGLAEIVERQGVRIFEHSEVTEFSARFVRTRSGTVTSPVILRCTEGYSSQVAKDPRRIIPINSSIIVTDPIPHAVWAEIGWEGYELFSDAAHVFSYAQRTHDDRILIGGRGNPYRFGSGTGGDGVVDERTLESLTTRLHRLFPSTAPVPIAHTWSGVLGVTRDWCASVRFDEASGLGHAQGYAGHGVTSAYLAAKSLAEVVTKQHEEDFDLAWSGRQTRNWEPEPIRWVGVHAMYRMFEYADLMEERSNASQTSLLAKFGSRFAGLHE